MKRKFLFWIVVISSLGVLFFWNLIWSWMQMGDTTESLFSEEFLWMAGIPVVFAVLLLIDEWDDID